MHIHGNNATRYGKPTTAYRQNDCISQNALRLLGKIVFVIVLPISGSCQSMVYYIRGIIYNIYSKFPVGSSAINQNSKKARALTGSTFGIYSRFRWIQTNKSLLTVYTTILMTPCILQLCLCLLCNQTRRLIYRSIEPLYGECSYIEEKTRVWYHYTR